MKNLLKQLSTSLRKLLSEHLERQFNAQLEELDQFGHVVEKRVSDLKKALEAKMSNEKTSLDLFQIVEQYQRDMLQIMQQQYHEKGQDFYRKISLDYQQASTELLDSLPKKITQEQPRERFIFIKSDNFWIRAAKFFKRIFFYLDTTPRRFLNLFRRMFRKPALPVSYWNYHIPFRNLAIYYYDFHFRRELQDVICEVSKQCVQVVKNILKKEEEVDTVLTDLRKEGNSPVAIPSDLLQLNLTEEQAIINKLKTDFPGQIKQTLKKIDQSFAIQSERAGTIELPAFLFRNAKIKRARNRMDKFYQRQGKGWGNTLFAMFDDWKLDQELYYVVLLSKAEKKEIDRIFNEKIEEQLTHLSEIEKAISILKANLSKKENQKEVLRKKLVQQKYLAHKQLTTLIPNTVEFFIDQNFPAVANRLDVTIENLVKDIAQKRWLTKQISYDVPLKSSDLDPFSPYELISFESIPALTGKTFQIKSQVLKQSEKILADIDAIDKIIEFNIDSAINTLDTEDISVEEIGNIANEGINRAAHKLQEIQETLKRLKQNHQSKMDEALEEFCQSLIDLTINENAFNLRMRVTTAKTLRKTKDIKNIVFERLKNYALKAWDKGQVFYQKFAEYVEPLRRKVGLHKGDEAIDTALSDFLNNSQHIIKGLPVVYQRLYKIQPLSEMSLFVGREQEIDILKRAYENWQKERYASSVIVGERWSGMTTLIQYFMAKICSHKNVIRLNPELNLYHPKDFFDLWQKALKNDQITSVQEIIDALNSTNDKQIIILENLQNLYLRTIHGFECLKMLCEIISKTYKQNFWLCSCSLYSWHYLDQTIQLSSYFGYIALMDELSHSHIREIIIRRNNISGYMVRFEPSVKNLRNNKYIKLDDQDRQEYLKDQFFTSLNSFARGNISLALIFWLLSTKHITEDAIEISNFEEPDFSFMNSLSNEKVLALFMLVVHDGLTLELFTEVFNKPPEQSKLLLLMLMEDGILVNRDEVYIVNPLLYRQTVSLLKSRNFIY